MIGGVIFQQAQQPMKNRVPGSSLSSPVLTVHPYAGSFQDNKDLWRGSNDLAAVYRNNSQQQLFEIRLNSSADIHEERLSRHLKMMRLLFLCLLLPAATAVSEVTEGSGDFGVDDEDLIGRAGVLWEHPSGSNADKTTGVDETSEDNKFTLIIVITAVTVLTLSVAAIVTIMLVRRKMQYREQGIYSVPTEQDQKRAVPFLAE
ncbi:uncharacterized protein si:dkey-262k9.2 isoform X2 [Labrus bergylta]|uniref:uncharacterized protein si:dkey-262k9.2 isoform X2 n=1 Tax=Labrus bergylta TaxID=56723 RepID=UPI0033134C2B